jgi:hypothetical protein
MLLVALAAIVFAAARQNLTLGIALALILLPAAVLRGYIAVTQPDRRRDPATLGDTLLDFLGAVLIVGGAFGCLGAAAYMTLFMLPLALGYPPFSLDFFRFVGLVAAAIAVACGIVFAHRAWKNHG